MSVGVSAFVADVDGLLRVVGRLARCGDELGDLLDELDRSVGALHDTWSGEAAEAHRVAHRTWTAGFREMQEALGLMRVAADVARDNYATAAEANSRMWSQVR